MIETSYGQGWRFFSQLVSSGEIVM